VTPYRDQIAAAVQAVTIRGPVRYAWLGRVSRPLEAALEAAMDDTARETYLVTSLGHELYSSFYCHGRPVPARWGKPAPLTPDLELAAALSQANTGRGSWQRGWTVERLDDHEAVLMSDVRARVPLSNCRALDGIHPGAAVEIRVPKENLWLAPGFYLALSDAVDGARERGVLRAYWHVTPTGAAALMHALTTRLNAGGVPFRLKVADHPFRLDRCDGAVLYLPPAMFAGVRETLLDVATELGEHLRPTVPAFTLELAPGVGLAEHDSGPLSFGTARCRLIAEAIVSAHRRGVRTFDERIAIAASRFEEAGVAIDAPYREPSLSSGHVL
jgi:class II lanthipeptide synthase